MRFDGNKSLPNLKFHFAIEIFNQFKVCVLVGSLTPPLEANTPLGWGPTSSRVVTLETGRREVPGSNPGRACRLSRSEFSMKLA